MKVGEMNVGDTRIDAKWVRQCNDCDENIAIITNTEDIAVCVLCEHGDKDEVIIEEKDRPKQCSKTEGTQ